MKSSQSKDTHASKHSTGESQEKWDIFVCHASEDKNDVVRPLVEALVKDGLRVWYDEFSLTIGDPLRRSIDKGLAQSRYGLVVLSPNFFAKNWPQTELDGLAARERDGRKVILPIWHRVDEVFIRKFSPTLADRLAVSTAKGTDFIVKEILKVVRPRQIEGNHREKQEHREKGNEGSSQFLDAFTNITCMVVSNTTDDLLESYDIISANDNPSIAVNQIMSEISDKVARLKKTAEEFRLKMEEANREVNEEQRRAKVAMNGALYNALLMGVSLLEGILEKMEKRKRIGKSPTSQEILESIGNELRTVREKWAKDKVSSS